MMPDLDSSGAVQGVYVFGIDDTERKRALIELQASREKLAEAQAIAHVGNWEFDLATDRLEWSDEVYRIYGHAPGSFTPHFRADYLPATHPDDRQKLLDALAYVLETRAPHAIEHRIILPNGDERVVEVRAQFPRADAAGNVVRLVGVVQDVTERSRVSAELLAARDAAEAGSRAKSAFLANMSHEVRTPMNGVIGMAELLLREPLGDKGRRYAETIQRSGRALLGVLDDVLDLSKVEAGQLRLEVAPLDLSALVIEMKDLFGEAARAKGIRLSLEVAPDAARWVTGDALRLRQVLLNLVSNAVKFTGQGTIAVSARGEAGGAVRFEVKDTGIGIAHDQQARIFDAFAQAEDGTTRRYGGTGLGLSISRHIVGLMGGTIGVHSVPGEGSLFWFSVPLAEALAPGAAQLATGGGAPAGKALAGRRVLVVEDEPVNAEVTRAMLLRLGVEVVTADDGAQAVVAHARQAFDCVLMDCQMPVMDGLEATRRIRGAEAAGGAERTPIVALTAHVLPEHRKDCIDAGMDDYLAKPFSATALEQVLARQLETRHRQ